MDLKKIGCEFLGWIYLAQNRNQWQLLLNRAMNFQVS